MLKKINGQQSRSSLRTLREIFVLFLREPSVTVAKDVADCLKDGGENHIC